MRHKWTKSTTVEHTRRCDQCGLQDTHAPIEDSLSWRITWSWDGMVRVGGSTPPCPPTASDFTTDRE